MPPITVSVTIGLLDFTDIGNRYQTEMLGDHGERWNAAFHRWWWKIGLSNVSPTNRQVERNSRIQYTMFKLKSVFVCILYNQILRAFGWSQRTHIECSEGKASVGNFTVADLISRVLNLVLHPSQTDHNSQTYTKYTKTMETGRNI